MRSPLLPLIHTISQSPSSQKALSYSESLLLPSHRNVDLHPPAKVSMGKPADVSSPVVPTGD